LATIKVISNLLLNKAISIHNCCLIK